MHLSTLSLGASNCIDGPLFVCVEKRGSPAPSIAGVHARASGRYFEEITSCSRHGGAGTRGAGVDARGSVDELGISLVRPHAGTHDSQRQATLMLSKALRAFFGPRCKTA